MKLPMGHFFDAFEILSNEGFSKKNLLEVDHGQYAKMTESLCTNRGDRY
mgnify:CR=1 FL=1